MAADARSLHATPDATLAADALPEPFADAVASAGQGSRVLVLRDGKPVAFLVPVADAEALEAVEDAHGAEPARLAWEEYAREGHAWPSYAAEELAARWGIDAGDAAAP